MTESRYIDSEDEAFNEIERRAKQRKEAVRATINKGKTMNNQPAFPSLHWVAPQGHSANENPQGMTLRDYFAAKALTTMFYPAIMESIRTDVDLNCDKVAEFAYDMADAMLKAREA